MPTAPHLSEHASETAERGTEAWGETTNPEAPLPLAGSSLPGWRRISGCAHAQHRRGAGRGPPGPGPGRSRRLKDGRSPGLAARGRWGRGAGRGGGGEGGGAREEEPGAYAAPPPPEWQEPGRYCGDALFADFESRSDCLGRFRSGSTKHSASGWASPSPGRRPRRAPETSPPSACLRSATRGLSFCAQRCPFLRPSQLSS